MNARAIFEEDWSALYLAKTEYLSWKEKEFNGPLNQIERWK